MRCSFAAASFKAAARAAASRIVFSWDIEIRIVVSASLSVSPYAVKTELALPLLAEQALPADTQMPFADRKLSTVSLRIDGIVKLIIFER